MYLGEMNACSVEEPQRNCNTENSSDALEQRFTIHCEMIEIHYCGIF
jgi:hypothetical protein